MSGAPKKSWLLPMFAALVATVATGATAYVTFGTDKVTRDEHREDLKNLGPPWMADKPVVEHRLDTLTTAQEQLTKSVQSLSVDTAKVVQRLDDFLEAQDR